MQTLAEFKNTFDPAFQAVVAEKVAQATVYTGNPDLAALLSYFNQYVAGGKRFRPYVVALSYELAGGAKNAEDIAPVLYAIELLHIFALIHDDIMDKAPLRHGIQSAHAFAADRYGNAHHGASQAILLGDLAFAWAAELYFGATASGSVPVAVAAHAAADFSELTKEVIVGQMLDAHLAATAHAYRAPLADIETKNRLKTAHYSFSWPLVIGNTLAGGSIARRNALMDFGTALGLAFQAQDDLLDVASADTGKSQCSDIEQGQQTILSGFIFNQGTAEQQATLASWQGILLSDEQKAAARAFMQESGAVAHAMAYTEQQLAVARDTITTQLSDESPIWLSLISEIQQRSK